jgi:Ca-activated chloride channel family protein
VQDRLTRYGFDVQRDLNGESKVYAENQRSEISVALNKLLVREALLYGLASSETAFVAVRSEAGRPIEGTVVVSNALPSGWSSEFVGGGYASASLGLMSMSVGASAPPMAFSRGMLQADSWSADEDSPALELAKGGSHSNKARRRKTRPLDATLFQGTPAFQQGEALLFETSDDATIPEEVTLTNLRFEFLDGAPTVDNLDPALQILLFVDDLASPRARMSVADLLRQGGERPLNIRRKPGQRVRVVLTDINGGWTQTAPRIGVSLRWS